MATLAPDPGLSAVAKSRLVLEILVSYAAVRRRLVDGDLTALVAQIRAARPRCPLVDFPDPGRNGDLRLGRAIVLTLEAVPLDSRCLMRSLVLLRLLARRGRGAELVIAVREPSPEGLLDAHAWLERDGVALLWPGDSSFERLLTL